jgi:Bacterial dnaA protein helix-turn-helix
MSGVATIGSVARIQGRVAEVFGVTRADMLSRRHNRRSVIPRHVAMYLARKLTPHSMPAIGRCFGRDHTTVVHAIKATNDRMEHWPSLKRDVDALEKELGRSEVSAAQEAVEDLADDVADQIRTLASRAFDKDPIQAALAVRDALRAVVGK